MKRIVMGLALVAAIAMLAPMASARPPICCGTDGSCEDGQKLHCWDVGVCDPGMVCWSEAGAWCTGAVGGCRLRNGNCILADAACVDALNCTPDASCLMPPNPEPPKEEVTWCDADEPITADETPCDDEVTEEQVTE